MVFILKPKTYFFPHFLLTLNLAFIKVFCLLIFFLFLFIFSNTLPFGSFLKCFILEGGCKFSETVERQGAYSWFAFSVLLQLTTYRSSIPASLSFFPPCFHKQQPVIHLGWFTQIFTYETWFMISKETIRISRENSI